MEPVILETADVAVKILVMARVQRCTLIILLRHSIAAAMATALDSCIATTLSKPEMRMTCSADSGSEHNMNFVFFSSKELAISKTERKPALLI